MISSLVAVGLLLRSQPDPHFQLNYENAGCTFTTLTRELSEKTGWEFEVAPDAANEVVVLRATGQTAEEVFGKIGEASYTKWEFLDDRVRVSLDRVRREETITADRREHRDAVWNEVQSLIQEGLKGDEIDPENPEYSEQANRSYRFFANIVRTIPRTVIDRVADGERVVLTATPNRFQEKLTGVNQSELVAVVEFTNFIVKTLREEGFPFLGGGSVWGEAPIDLSQHRLQVILTAGSPLSREAVSIHGQFVNQAGVRFTLNSVLHEFYDDSEEPEEEMEPPKPVSKWSEAVLATKLDFSKRAAEFWAIDKNNSRNDFVLTPDAAEALRKPTVYEPLGLGFGELYLALAKACDVPIVAGLSDDLDMPDAAFQGQTLSDFINEKDLEGYEFRPGGWITVPLATSALTRKRTDRQDFEKLLNSSPDGFSILPHVYGEFSLRRHSRDSAFDYPAIAICWPGWLDNVEEDYYEYAGPLLFGGLSDASRKTLWEGGRVPLSALSPAARQYLENRLLEADRDLDQRDFRPGAYNLAKGVGNAITFGGWDGGSPDYEITELILLLSSQGFLQGQVSTGSYLGRAYPDGSGVKGPFLMREQLANIVRMGDDRSKPPRPSLNNMRRGTYRKMLLQVHVANGLGAEWPVVEFDAPDMYKAYGFFDLPEDVKRQAREDYAVYEQSRYYSPPDEDDGT